MIEVYTRPKECLVTWWDSPKAPYMSAHVCFRPTGHDGRHTCFDHGCRSWRPNKDTRQEVPE